MSCEFTDGQVVPGTAYRVVRRIGQGGMGSVYEVEHRALGKRFVLKALLSGLMNRSDLVQRLKNEWRALGRLEHPAIVSVTDAGLTTSGVPYYVMERLNGETLGGRLRRLGRLPPREALVVAAEVLEALDAAHAIGVVHRDVKPPNIFITDSGATKLLDFGIAKLVHGRSSRLTGRGMAIGTPRYMAPEQAVGDPVDGRCDVYAMGLVLFEALAGHGAFQGVSSNEVFVTHVTKDAPRLSTVLSGVSEELDDAVSWLLMTNPSERPATAGRAAQLLRALSRREITLEERGSSGGNDGRSEDPLTTESTPSTFDPISRAALPGVGELTGDSLWDSGSANRQGLSGDRDERCAARRQPATYRLSVGGPDAWASPEEYEVSAWRSNGGGEANSAADAPVASSQNAMAIEHRGGSARELPDSYPGTAPPSARVPANRLVLLIAAAAAFAGVVLVAVSILVLDVGVDPAPPAAGLPELRPATATSAVATMPVADGTGPTPVQAVTPPPAKRAAPQGTSSTSPARGL